MRSFVGSGMQRWGVRKGHVVPGRIGLRADRSAGAGSVTTDVSLHPADIMATERTLDLLGVRELLTGTCDALCGSLLDRFLISAGLGR